MMFSERLFLSNYENDVVLIGEILVDIIHNGDIHKQMGGSVLNITRNLASLGVNANFFGSVGNDPNGVFLLEQLETDGVNKKNINILHKETSTVDVYQNEETPIPVFKRSSDYHIYFDRELEILLAQSKILHFSYWPLSREPSKSTVFEALKLAKAKGVIVGFDPNFHPNLLDEDSISTEELKQLLVQVDIIKPSLDDTIRLFGERESLEEYIEIYENFGCKLIVLSLGSKGLIASYKGERINLPSMATEVVEVTGAGDAFWSGLYTGLIQENSILDSIKLGLACSAHVLRVIGAKVEFPSIDELKEEFGI